MTADCYYLLFDLDHTLLDFNTAEGVALTEPLQEARVSDIQAHRDLYIPVNRQLWDDLSLKRITKKELVNMRFTRLFANFGHEVDRYVFAKRYQEFLSQQGQTLVSAGKLPDNLSQQGYCIFGVTNGTTKTQTGCMVNSTIKDHFEYVFVSDEVDYQKPDKGFHDVIAGAISQFNHQEVLMIGDNLLVGAQGGNNAGIDTVWYNPACRESHTKATPTYVVKDYQGLSELLR